MADAAQAQNNKIVNANTPDSSTKLPTAVQNKAAELPAAVDTTKVNGKLPMPDKADKREQYIKRAQALSTQPLRDTAIAALDIPDEHDRGSALAKLIPGQSAPDSKIITSMIEEPVCRVIAQVVTARIMRRAGEKPSEMLNAALKTTLKMERDLGQSVALYRLSEELIKDGNYTHVKETFKTASIHNFRQGILQKLTTAHIENGNSDEAISVAASERNPYVRSSVQAHVARAIEKKGGDPCKLLSDAEISANKTAEPYRSKARADITATLIDFNELDDARRVASTIEDANMRSLQQTEIAVKIVEAGGDPTEMFAQSKESALAAKDNFWTLHELGKAINNYRESQESNRE